MNKYINYLSTILAFVTIIIFGGLLYFLLNKLLDYMTSMNSEINVAIIAGAVTILVSVVSIAVGKAYETKISIRKEIRDKKIPVYEDLIKFMFDVLFGPQLDKVISEKQIIEFMADFTQRIMVWGSDDVLASWIKFRQASVNKDEVNQSPNAFILLYEDLIKEIRIDLGHKNKGLKKGDLLSLFLNDINNIIIPVK